MPVSSADVPGKYDVVFTYSGNSYGYCFLDSVEPSLPFRTHRAIYSTSPTFVDRQNVSGGFGDNQQDFWLTASQDDWSEGEDQRFFRASDADSSRRYFQGGGVDVRIPGQASMRQTVKSITAASSPKCAIGVQNFIYFATTTNLYKVDNTGAVTDLGAHGLGAAPSGPNSIASDGNNIYLTSVLGGSVGIRRWNIGTPAFTTFSASTNSSLLYWNNTLYALGGAGLLRSFDTAGTPTTRFTWQDAVGTATGPNSGEKLLAFGGKILIFRGYQGNNTVEGRAELWVYDGNGVSLLTTFEPNFYANDATIAQGIIFVYGSLQDPTTGTPAVFYVANGTMGLLWKKLSSGTASSIIPFDGGVVWVDGGQYVYYNIATGGISRFAAAGNSAFFLASNTYNFLSYINNTTATELFPDTVRPTSSTIITSMFDFESSLDKLFRGVKIDFTPATTGDGGSVDIAYRVGDPDGSFTNLQTGAVSGTEYLLANITGRKICLKITLNKGTSTAGPVLKRTYVRAAPLLQSYPHREFILDLTSTAKQPRKLRDGSYHPLSGAQQAANLNTMSLLQTPFTWQDRFGSGTGLLDLNATNGFDIIEIHPSTDEPTKSGGFVARLVVRGV